MAKITFLLGLAGSGKSLLAEKLKKETGAEFFEGTEGDPTKKQQMVEHLTNGGSCIVEEIAYCLPSRREAIVSTICSLGSDIEIEWICFENDLHNANWNVMHRNNKGDVPGHLRINQCYHGLYIYPSGAKVIPIVRIDQHNSTALASKLKRHGGFWFPLLAKSLDALYKHLSLGHRLNVWLDDRGIGGAWVSEAYQLLSVLIGFLWLTLIHLPVLTGSAWIILGVTAALYRPSEIILFSTHWLLVARGPVKDYRRSLAGFLVNFVELGLYVAVAFVLLGSFGPNASAWQILEISIRAVFTLSLPNGITGDAWSGRIAMAQLAAAWLLAVLVVANVVGGITRGELTAKDKDGAA